MQAPEPYPEPYPAPRVQPPYREPDPREEREFLQDQIQVMEEDLRSARESLAELEKGKKAEKGEDGE